MTETNSIMSCPTCNKTLKKRVNSKLTPETVKVINVSMGWGWGQDVCMGCEIKRDQKCST